jgi:hypothetical protein
VIHDVSDDVAEGRSDGPRVVIDAHRLRGLLATYLCEIDFVAVALPAGAVWLGVHDFRNPGHDATCSRF